MRRFRLIPFSEMTPEQRAYADAVKSGPTARTGSAPIVAATTSMGSPFNVYLRSPVLAQQLLKVAEHIRFKSSLPTRLNEFAILVTARHWTAQYEWFAHHRLALKAGLNPAVAEDLAQGSVCRGRHCDRLCHGDRGHGRRANRRRRYPSATERRLTRSSKDGDAAISISTANMHCRQAGRTAGDVSGEVQAGDVILYEPFDMRIAHPGE